MPGFQKGHIPKTCNPIGYERTCSVTGYTLVRVAGKHPKGRTLSGWYRHKHVLVWEAHHGPVPPDCCLRFKDGDKSNITIENLMLLTKGESMRLNQLGYAGIPEDFKSVLRGIARLDQALYEKNVEKVSTSKRAKKAAEQMRSRIKAAGISAYVRKYEINRACGVRVFAKRDKGERFTRAQQRQIKRMAKEGGLTGLKGLEIDVGAPFGDRVTFVCK